jgi:plastocyanin
MQLTKFKTSLSVLLIGLISMHINAETIEVQVYKKKFIPAEISINEGDTVRWVNKEKRQYHNVWFEASGEEEPQYFFPGETYEKTFNKAGEFDYRCGPHPKMIGRVSVNNAQRALTQKRIGELSYLAKQDCGSCHGMLFKGGLGPALLPKNLSDFSHDAIAAVILHGRPGTAMPPWKGILSKQDALWIAQSLKSGQMLNRISENK